MSNSPRGMDAAIEILCGLVLGAALFLPVCGATDILERIFAWPDLSSYAACLFAVALGYNLSAFIYKQFLLVAALQLAGGIVTLYYTSWPFPISASLPIQMLAYHGLGLALYRVRAIYENRRYSSHSQHHYALPWRATRKSAHRA